MIEDFSGSTPVEPPKQNDTETQNTAPAPLPESGGIPMDMAIDGLGSPSKSKKKRSFKLWPSHLSKKKQIALAVFLVLLIGGIIGFFVYTQLFAKTPTTYVAPAGSPQEAKPTTEASQLTGIQVQPELNQRGITAVMIENSPDARPQSGLTEAGVVYEAVAEGGITRFVALYQEAQPARIGPVRSSRPYYLDWLLPYGAMYAHVGGSPEAIKQIRSLGIKDLDQFYNSSYYQRIPERYAPHNMYTSMKQLDAGRKARKYDKGEFKGFERKEEKAQQSPTVTKISMDISSVLYNIEYGYEDKTNSYKRSMGGKAHKDEKSGKTINPKVVIALVMNKGLAKDDHHTTYKTTGSGKMFVFQDGGKTTGTWKKLSRTSQFTFTDAQGKTIQLNPGQTWITIVDNPGAVVAKP